MILQNVVSVEIPSNIHIYGFRDKKLFFQNVFIMGVLFRNLDIYEDMDKKQFCQNVPNVLFVDMLIKYFWVYQ